MYIYIKAHFGKVHKQLPKSRAGKLIHFFFFFLPNQKNENKFQIDLKWERFAFLCKNELKELIQIL